MQIRPRLGRTIVVALVLGASLAAGGAFAAGATDDRTSTAALLRELESGPKKDVAAELISRSRAAQARADKLRASGDETHARLADALAKTWAEAARDLVRAVAVEEKAHATRRAANDAGVVAERERALLEEGIAQSGRVRAQLEAAERESKEQPARTSIAATLETDGGAPKPSPAPARDGGAR